MTYKCSSTPCYIHCFPGGISLRFAELIFIADAIFKHRRMQNRRIIALLMLLMAIMPMAAAYAHYSEIGPHFSMQHAVTASDIADADSSAAAPADGHCQPGKAHPSTCNFHPCLDCAVTTSFAFQLTQAAAYYQVLLNPDSLSTIPSPDIKPPISHL